MNDFQVIEVVKQQRNNTLRKNSAVLEHQIEKKLIKTVGNNNRNGGALTTTATSSSAKISLTSNTVGKSVVSSLSMSLARKDSIHYMPRKIVPCTIPAGQNTVIHLDNYTHFMAQSVTTKTAFRSSETGEDKNPYTLPCSSKKAYNGSVDIVDLNVVVGGVDSLYHSNKKTSNMNKQKLQDEKPVTPSQVRGLKNSLAVEYKKPKQLKINIKRDIPDTTTRIKPVVKKPNRPRRKKVIKPRKSKIKTKSNAMQDIAYEESDKVKVEKSISPFVTSRGENKLFRPCTYTMQRKKCLNEMTCSYLHSDFPCKYYYLNIPCPQDFKCQFMHNGPLAPNLTEALRNHILDLLSTNPSAIESHFVEQIHHIEDLWHRLQSFQVIQHQCNEIIEVMDDADEDHELVIDESSDDVNANNDTANTNTLSNSSYESDEMHPQYAIDKLDMIYEKFKETNYAVDEIDKKLKCLKTSLNITPNEKIHQLQIIYDLLKEQEKRLQVYESATAAAQTTVCDDEIKSALTLPSEIVLIEKEHIVLVDPNIVKDIVTLESQENGTNGSCKENSIAAYKDEAVSTNLPVVEGTEFLTNEDESLVILNDDENNANPSENKQTPTSSNVPMQIGTERGEEIKETSKENTNLQQNTSSHVPQESGIELISVEVLPTVGLRGNHDITNNSKNDAVAIFNLPCDQNCETATLTGRKQIFDNTELTENCLIAGHNVGDIEIHNVHDNASQKIGDEKSFEIIDQHEITQVNNTLIFSDERTELDIAKDEGIIENNIKETSHQDIEERSPFYEKLTPIKAEKRSRIRLRSHRLQDNEEINQLVGESLSPTDRTKPIRSRRLRLPKPSQKTSEKSIIDEGPINADVIKKLVKSTKNTCNETEEPVTDVEIPLTQNIILSKRFLKKAKAKLEQTQQSIDIKNCTNLNVDQNMSALESSDSKTSDGIENIDVSLLTQTSDDNYFSNTLQHSLVTAGDCDSLENIDAIYNNAVITILPENLKLSEEIEKAEKFKKQNLQRDISFENSLSTLPNAPYVSIKEKYNLGNPQVLLAKLKTPFLPPTTQNEVQADSTTSFLNQIVTSSPSAEDKVAQKRHSLIDETDLDSSLKESKILKFDNSQSARKIKIDKCDNKTQGESNHSNHLDFETDSSEENKLSVASPYSSFQRQEGLQSSPTHREKHKPHTQREHREHKEQTENESDLRQQIENVSSKSDLQLQTQQQQQQRLQQQKEVEKVSKTAATTTFITKNGNNLPHKQYRQQENVMSATEDEKDLLNHQLHEESKSKEKEIANTCKSYDNIERDQDGRTQSVLLKCIYEPEKLASNASNKYSNDISVVEEETNVKHSTSSALFNKLTNNSTKCQINFEDSCVNITPISSPTYGNDDTIASPSPIRKLSYFHMDGEIDGRLTYPPTPYILYEVDLGKMEVNKPLCIDKLRKTTQLDPRVFRTHIKKQSMIVCKPIETTANAVVPMPSTSNKFNLSHDSSSQTTSSISSSYDPRNRSSAAVTADLATQSLSQQTALTAYNSLQTAVVPSSFSSASVMQTGVADAVPFSLQYRSTSQPIIQPQPQPQQQQQQTPNMFLYGCLQRSAWYQSLMSTMKIQINQSISQLVRALNSFHRERVFNPEMVFDIFKIDCAGELLEIMRNLGIFVDANGHIKEQRHMPSFAGRSCCNNAPVNATYSFIQQYLTPNTHCTSLTTASSTYSAASVAGPQCQLLNVNEPFVSCYVKVPEAPQKHSNDCCSRTHHSHNDDNNCSRNCNNRNDNSRKDNYNRYENNNNNNNSNNYSGGRRYSNSNSNSNSCHQRSNQRSSYNNNTRFMKAGACSPSKSNSSPSSSPKNEIEGGSGVRGGRDSGGRLNNSKRFNNYNKDHNKNNNWSSKKSNDNRYNNKYENNSSPPRRTSPITVLSRATAPKPSSPKAENSEEECWD